MASRAGILMKYTFEIGLEFYEKRGHHLNIDYFSQRSSNLTKSYAVTHHKYVKLWLKFQQKILKSMADMNE